MKPFPENDPRHGTAAGFQAHKRRGQTPCPLCYQGKRDIEMTRYLAMRGEETSEHRLARAYAETEPEFFMVFV